MITFLIGNGFDIKVGLKSRYTDFYKVYTKERNGDSKTIRRFKSEILKSEAHNWINWADFELQMGKHSSSFDGDTPTEDFIECFNDFVVSFNDYLIDECASIDWENTRIKDMASNFRQSLTNFYNHIQRTDRTVFTKLIGNGLIVNTLQFNYTNIFDKLLALSGFNTAPYGARLGTSLHVHGRLGEKGYLTMGVNDESQIANQTMRAEQRLHKIFVKPQFLEALQSRAVNQESIRNKALKAIKGSVVICTFGSSIGATDRFWWDKIGEWLKSSGGILVIFDRCGASDDGISPLAFLNSETTIDERKNEIMERFLQLSGFESDWIDKNPDRIIIELDTAMFNFTLPRKT